MKVLSPFWIQDTYSSAHDSESDSWPTVGPFGYGWIRDDSLAYSTALCRSLSRHCFNARSSISSLLPSSAVLNRTHLIKPRPPNSQTGSILLTRPLARRKSRACNQSTTCSGPGAFGSRVLVGNLKRVAQNARPGVSSRERPSLFPLPSTPPQREDA